MMPIRYSDAIRLPTSWNSRARHLRILGMSGPDQGFRWIQVFLRLANKAKHIHCGPEDTIQVATRNDMF